MGALILQNFNRIGVLLLLILLGWVLAKCNVLPRTSTVVLAKLEQTVCLPAMLIQSFSACFVPRKLLDSSSLWGIMALIVLASALLAPILAKISAREESSRKLYIYALSFSAFGLVGGMFPGHSHTLLSLPLWLAVGFWGIPCLLLPGAHRTAGAKLQAMCNPLTVGMLIGILLGCTGWRLPGFVQSAVSLLSDCVLPLAMVLLGISFAGITFGDAFASPGAWILAVIRLLLLPALAILLLILLPLSHSIEMSVVTLLALPPGLLTVICPAAYGKQSTTGVGLTMLCCALSCITLPLIYWIAENLL